MKQFSLLITDTLEGNSLYLIEDNNEKAFFAKVGGYHECARYDLGVEGQEREEITAQELDILIPRLKSGKHTKIKHGITRYEYRYITFMGELVED